MIVVVMGVTGSGKTAVGKVLANQLGWKFFDADDYHSAANKDKMRRGIPLTDQDRKPWLETLAKLIDDARDRGDNIVLACSALKHDYQEYLRHHLDVVRYVCLFVDRFHRLAPRTDFLCQPGTLSFAMRLSSGFNR
jgi:gluconokinase